MAGKKASKKATSSRAGKPRSVNIDCEESLDITVAGELHEKLSRAIKGKKPVVIDTARVKRTDAAILQLFCAFSRAAKQAEIGLQWKTPSEEFMATVKRLDLTALLELPAQGVGAQGSDS